MYDGTVYEGEWKNDVFHGKGKLAFPSKNNDDNGITYVGTFSNGKQDLKGKLIYNDGSVYVGELE